MLSIKNPKTTPKNIYALKHGKLNFRLKFRYIKNGTTQKAASITQPIILFFTKVLKRLIGSYKKAAKIPINTDCIKK